MSGSTPFCSTNDVFAALGGPAAVGRVINITTEHASALKRRGRIPPRYWSKLLAGLTEVGLVVTEGDLVLIYNARHEASTAEVAA